MGRACLGAGPRRGPPPGGAQKAPQLVTEGAEVPCLSPFSPMGPLARPSPDPGQVGAISDGPGPCRGTKTPCWCLEEMQGLAMAGPSGLCASVSPSVHDGVRALPRGLCTLARAPQFRAARPPRLSGQTSQTGRARWPDSPAWLGAQPGGRCPGRVSGVIPGERQEARPGCPSSGYSPVAGTGVEAAPDTAP